MDVTLTKAKNSILLVLLMLFSLQLLSACDNGTATSVPTGTTAAATTGKQPLKISLSYIPNVQFAPYYVALDKGYFADEGLDVSFDYSTVDNLLALVGQGKVPFAIAGGDEVLQARAGGIPVTYLATQYQKYPIALAAPVAKNIKTIADLKGKVIGVPGPYGANYIGLKALLAGAKLSEQDISMQSIGFTQREALSQGKVDAAMVYSMNEPVQLQKAGVALDVIQVSSVVNLASIGLVTGDSMISSNPTLVQKVTRAVQRGIKDTIANPDAAFDSSLKVAPDAKGSDAELQRAVLKETVKFMSSDAVQGQLIGYSDPKLWTATQQFLLDNSLTHNKIEASTAFTNKFLSDTVGKYGQ